MWYIDKLKLKREDYIMFYTKEMIHTEFKMATQKDERNAMRPAGKKSYKHRIEYLKALIW